MRPANSFLNLCSETSNIEELRSGYEMASLSARSDGGKEKHLRTIPRKISHVDLEELLTFDNFVNTISNNDPFQEQAKKSEEVPKFVRQISLNEIASKDEAVYRKVAYSVMPISDKLSDEEEQTVYSCKGLLDLMDIRDKYILIDEFLTQHPLVKSVNDISGDPIVQELTSSQVDFSIKDGVYQLYVNENLVPTEVVPVEEFYSDLELVLEASSNPVLRRFCSMRLGLLEKRFNMHVMFNADRENDQCSACAKDFYNIMKVDNHVHLSACMNQKHLQKFMRNKLITEGNTVVAAINGEEKTLSQVFESIGITSKTLNIDMLNCFAERIFYRFDRFNNKYNPLGQPLLREIFLKTDNKIKGRFFAEICREVFNRLEDEKYLTSEYRVSIYGRRYEEWQKLSEWFISHKLESPNVRWLIQIPRLYKVYRSTNAIKSFEEMLINIFGPIFEATLHPEDHPLVSEMLTHIVGFDSVDDESQMEKIRSYSNYQKVTPRDWTAEENPTYSYWSYYLYANVTVINVLRRARGLNTFAFRPHCGEAHSKDHLATAFLTAHSINHGIELRHDPVVLYLFYLKQIGLSISPVSNSKIFLKFLKTPFPKFFKMGLNVALSTDDPLMLHLTKEPLLEEYSVMAQALDFNVVDLCEIARNSVLQSSYPRDKKRHWLGEHYESGLPDDQDSNKTNVPWIRYSYRYENFHDEMNYIIKHGNADS